MQQSVRRLIDGFRPSHYDLFISQDSKSLSFHGMVSVQGVRGSAPLLFHTNGLGITSVMVNDQQREFTIDNDSQELTVVDTSTGGTELIVVMEFKGGITPPMHGLYPCYFQDVNDVKQCLLATQFESHHAREVFPCIDEPEAKATFQLRLTVPDGDIVVSNTPILSSEDAEDQKLTTHTFEQTPVMSTYLLAWVSGDLICDEAMSDHGISVRAYTTPIHKGKVTFALDIATKALDYLDDYFDIPYPLKKYDIVALPDFAAAAMENWGMVTYREGSMLIDEHSSDLADKQHVANVTIHEISHQWFGNLVTMRWWNDLWLNEGFASWIPYMVTDDLFPEWNIWDQFATDDLAIGLRADALEHTHPIVVEINSPEEIRSAFDSISYDKGCSVINLVYRYIGKEAFRAGLQTYLKTHAYANAETKDLWQAWSKSSGKDVITFMKTWTEAAGFPLLRVSNNDTELHVEQTRFFLNPVHQKDDTLWSVPLIRSSSDTVVMTERSLDLEIAGKLNSGQSGFYRVIYDGKIKNDITAQLVEGTLHPNDTLGLIADASEAAKAGYHSSLEALELMQYVGKTTSEPLLSSTLGEITEYRSIFADSYEAFKPFVHHLIASNLTRLGIEPNEHDSIDDQLMRPTLLACAIYAGDQPTIDWAVTSFNQASNADDLRADVRSVIYQAAVKHDLSVETYEKLLRWYFETTIPGEQLSLAGALAGVDDQPLMDRTLGLLSAGEVRLQDARFWIAYALRNRTQKQLAWEWMKRNWQWIGDNYGQEKEMDYFLRYCATGFTSEEHLKDYTDFFSTANIYGSDRAFEQGKETIRWQSAWKQRDSEQVDSWLKKFTF